MTKEKLKVCKWKYDEDYNCWQTDCGVLYHIHKGTPKDNDMKFCHICDLPLESKE